LSKIVRVLGATTAAASIHSPPDPAHLLPPAAASRKRRADGAGGLRIKVAAFGCLSLFGYDDLSCPELFADV